MKRTLSSFLVLLMVVALLSACQTTGKELSDKKKQEISNVLMEEKGIVVDWNSVCCARYYGSYNGYLVILNPGQATWVETQTVAGYDFVYGSSFQMYAYKEGKVYELKEAYETSLLTKEQIGQIYDCHVNYDTDAEK